MPSGVHSLPSQLFQDLGKGQSPNPQAHPKIPPWLINRHWTLTHEMKNHLGIIFFLGEKKEKKRKGYSDLLSMVSTWQY